MGYVIDAGRKATDGTGYRKKTKKGIKQPAGPSVDGLGTRGRI